jgi:hypothetical protein
MKGLSLTLTIVIVAIVLLVTALVVMTIFGAQMANILNILNPWAKGALDQNSCRQQCASWCMANVGKTEADWSSDLKAPDCVKAMEGISTKCLCTQQTADTGVQ